MKKSLLIILVFVVIFSLPLLFKSKNNRHVVGPKLSEVTYSEITFINKYDSIKLSGMLFSPRGVDSFPLAIIINGSGTSSRTNPWYLTVAQYLQRNGIGVLLPDKRGSEKSEGNWRGVSLETLAKDTEAAIEFIQNQANVQYSKIGIIGMSQGGWIAPIVASNRKDISFIVNMSGSMTTTDDQLLFEEYNNIRPYTYDFIAQLISPLTTKSLKRKKHIEALLGYDPAPYWKTINRPVFLAYGGGDTNCPVEKSVEIMKQINKSNFTYRIYPKGGHGILNPVTSRISDDFLEDLKEFIEVSEINCY